ncbi:hypothetical protein [Gimesia aquarii]|uniref:ABC-2 family transporter protein n=1 Tax=Gimesia aquarii TaxID=2527964 RepID=A0A517WXN2_9PLAN|nr:hypothetical protein [Gimesia aquarii]QDU10013.1 ABC-2 family transporter protein [Gimesia aquarii]
MDLVLQSLLWKEWQEKKRILFVCLAWILCGVLYVVTYESTFGYRTPVARFGSICLVYSLFMTVFLAMRVCLSEVTHQTLSLSLSLPVSLQKIATVRLGFAVFSLVGPILLGALILAVLLASGVLEQVPARAEGFPSGFAITKLPSLSVTAAVILLAKITSIAIVQSMALFLILAVIGARRRREVHIGFIGAAVAFAWIFPTEARMMLQSSGFTHLQDWIGALFPQSMVIFYGYGDGQGSFSDLDLANRIWIPLFLNLIILSGLAYWFTRRYGTRTGLISHRKRRWIWMPLFSWISFPHRRESSSLIWINLRQTVPLALAGLVLACVMAIANILSMGPSDGRPVVLTAYSLPSAMWIVGILWATVVGSGIFAAELAPGLGHFWMSRPISINRWFWFKYFVGLFAVLMVLDGTTILVSWNSLLQNSSQTTFYNTNFLSWSYIACYPVLHSMMYSLAVLGVCWWKKPVRGAVVALSFFFIGSMVMESIPTISDYDPIFIYNNLFNAERNGEFSLTSFHFPLVFGMIGIIILLTAFLSSRKTQRLEV